MCSVISSGFGIIVSFHIINNLIRNIKKPRKIQYVLYINLGKTIICMQDVAKQ